MPTLLEEYSPANGASRGIGTAIPRSLAAEGTSLAVT